eukprot:COSAG01_NODE_1208_length_11239_cov_36.000987_16_plen_88_part_00
MFGQASWRAPASDGGWRRRRALWLLFNAAVVLFFGGLHQAGVARALVDLGTGTPSLAAATGTDGPAVVMFFHTYQLRNIIITTGIQN